MVRFQNDHELLMSVLLGEFSFDETLPSRQHPLKIMCLADMDLLSQIDNDDSEWI